MAKITTPDSLYGNSREILREAERENEILADIAGETYDSPGDIPKGKYIIEKRLLDAAQKKNELLESIAGSGGGGGAAKGINIDYGTDVISLKNKDGDPIQGSGATLPAYGVSFDPTTGGLTLTKNGTAMQGQTVTIPNYGSPVGVTSASDMTDHDTIYLYEGTTGGGYTQGHFYYWDGTAWADGGEYAAATVQTDKTLLVENRAADAKATGEAVGELKTQINEISEPGENICYVTPFDNYKYTGGVYVSRNSETQLKIWGSHNGAWIRFNLLLGNSEFTANAPDFNTNLEAGTYTLKADDSCSVYYGTSWDNRQRWYSGESITLDRAVCVFIQSLTNAENYGTTDSPTLFNIEIFEGNVSIVPTAVDKVARSQLAEMANYDKIEEAVGETSYNKELVKADFDYNKPYNIFNGTTWTPNKKVDCLSGTLSDETGRYVTDYIEIDNTEEYLCVNIYVYLSGETAEGLVTGGNRVWIHTNWAFYDSDKNYIRGNAANEVNATSKSIPTNAKYVRLTINQASVIPYAVLFYGQYSTQQWVRYVEYRKEIIEEKTYAATGMEALKMVMFGDSITHGIVGLSSDGISYTDFANDYLRGNIINCGLGGTRMSQGLPDAIGLGSFASLCENIVSDNPTAWDALETYATASHADWNVHIAKLKAMDWNTVQAIGIWYGANDWHNNVPIGTEYNEDPTKYDGACAYGLKTLLTKYPHIQVIVFTPIFRIAETNSDTPNGAGLNMDDYGASLQHIRPVFHCPVVDAGNELGINRYTVYSYIAENDGTHPRKTLGLERMGRFLAESVKRYIQPY